MPEPQCRHVGALFLFENTTSTCVYQNLSFRLHAVTAARTAHTSLREVKSFDCAPQVNEKLAVNRRAKVSNAIPYIIETCAGRLSLAPEALLGSFLFLFVARQNYRQWFCYLICQYCDKKFLNISCFSHRFVCVNVCELSLLVHVSFFVYHHLLHFVTFPLFSFLLSPASVASFPNYSCMAIEKKNSYLPLRFPWLIICLWGLFC